MSENLKFFCVFVDDCPDPEREDCEQCLLFVRLVERFIADNSLPVENGGWEK